MISVCSCSGVPQNFFFRSVLINLRTLQHILSLYHFTIVHLFFRIHLTLHSVGNVALTPSFRFRSTSFIAPSLVIPTNDVHTHTQLTFDILPSSIYSFYFRKTELIIYATPSATLAWSSLIAPTFIFRNLPCRFPSNIF